MSRAGGIPKIVPRLCAAYMVVAVAAFGLSGCIQLPDRFLLDFPPERDRIGALPPYEDPSWILEQGLPLRRSWLEEGRTPIPGGEMYIIPYTLTALPYKNVEETKKWVAKINREYAPLPTWRYRAERRMGHYKCMSVSSSLIVDWFNLRRSAPAAEYRSLLNGKTERGFDHRKLDAIYYHRAGQAETEEDYPLLTLELDPVEQVPIPYNLEAFAKIIAMRGRNEVTADTWIETPDPTLPGVIHRFRAAELPALQYRILFQYVPSYRVAADPEMHTRLLVDALERYGPVLAGIRVRFASSGGVISATSAARLAIPNISGHGIVIVGYIRQEDRVYFVYRETFGRFDELTSHGGPAYRVYPGHAFNEAYVFHE